MGPFRSSHALAGNWQEAVSACVQQLAPLPGDASLGFVYATDVFADDLGEIVEALKRQTGVAQWVGTVGFGICGGDKEYYDRPALSVLLGALPREGFRIFGGVREDLEPFAQEHTAWVKGTGSRFAIVHGDPRNAMLPDLVEGISAELNDGFIVGGLTSSRGSYTQVAGTVTEGGLSGVMFAPGIAVATTLTQGCAPFGAVHEITGCQRNVIIEMDGRPALDVFSEEIGDVLARDLEQAAQIIGAALPIAGSDRRDYLVRNLVGADPERKLLAIGERVQEGQNIQFCRRDPDSAERDMRAMLRELKGRLAAPPHGAVYYSCVGRGQHLFGPDSRELGIVREELGEVPLAGFFCNGEISNNRLYGYTGVLTVFQ